jgi:hypothetical protein
LENISIILEKNQTNNSSRQNKCALTVLNEIEIETVA